MWSMVFDRTASHDSDSCLLFFQKFRNSNFEPSSVTVTDRSHPQLAYIIYPAFAFSPHCAERRGEVASSPSARPGKNRRKIA